MSWLANIGFGAPWLLAALIVLPAIWFLLRVTPPLPRRVVFPPLKLLLGLRDEEQTPAGTPWWLMLLRLVAAGLLIVALAEPQIGRTLDISGSGPIIVLADNGWTAAHDWDAREGLLNQAVHLAAQERRPIAIVATAGKPDTSFLDAGRAFDAARALAPQPWFAERLDALAALAKIKLSSRAEILWLADGIDDGCARKVEATLEKLGHVRIFRDAPGKTPLALTGIANTAEGIDAGVLRAGASGARASAVTAYGDSGETLGTGTFAFADGKNKAEARIFLPLEMRNKAARLEIKGEGSAGAVYLFDRGVPRRAAGLVSTGDANDEPLLSGLYYLERALSPYADLNKGTISDLLKREVSVLILADIGKIAGADHDKVVKFVENGGLLIRFAGEHLASGADDLVPVQLRSGGRYLGGALTWTSPQHLAEFPAASPFGGLEIPKDVTVSRQILAEPSIELSSHSWARLQDGTPMVTAARRGKGWIVLFHVTAGPSWSSLPMSGLYVGMLRRLMPLSAGTNPADMAGNAILPAAASLDGFGKLGAASTEALPIRASGIARMDVSKLHPPGLYGAAGAVRALNAAREDTALLPMSDSLATDRYAARAALFLQTPLLILGLLLVVFDFAISLVLRGFAPRLKFFSRIFGAALSGFVLIHSGAARANDAFDLKAALDTRLAYVVTGASDVDAMSKAGLTGLGGALAARTTYVPLEPIGVNLEIDNLSFFPLIYWPMDPRQKDLSPAALSKLADYMRSGGTILIDTRDLTLSAQSGVNSPGQQTLRRLIGKLDLPPLEPVPANHVLTRSFYLLSDFPGRWDGGKVWVQARASGYAQGDGLRGGDGVSPVIIGGNDWAAAWAVDAQGRPLADVTGGMRQREMAIRFGINVAMYALTGNYKTDQVHVSTILKRLGR